MSNIKSFEQYREFINESKKEKDFEKEALDILKSFKGGYDSNINYLRDKVKTLNKLKSKVTTETKKDIEKHIKRIKDVIKELK